MMSRQWVFLAALVVAGVVGANVPRLGTPSPAAQLAMPSRIEAAAPGLIEPFGEERVIASQVIGVIGKMLVEENDIVRADQPIAIVENSEQSSRLAAARAQLTEARAQLEKAINGARPEERREAEDNLAQIDADLNMANLDFARKEPLVKSGATTQATLDQSTATLRAIKARRAAAAERLAVIQAGTRHEDIAAARAVVARLEAETGLAQALLDKTIVRSPIDGVILRRQRNAGEAVTNIDPTPIAIVGDLSRLRVRAEVDETDIAHVRLGQRVEVTADAYPGQRFNGQVARIAQRLGEKQVNTGRPAERADMKVMQALIDLDPGVKLPVGLRVDLFFVTQGAPAVADR
jgi:HlyD family secretion protein